MDNQLRQTIRLDVDRAYQEKLLFQLPKTKETMTNALFTWCKLHAEVSYKQGMHEIMGIILFVVYAEQAQGDLDIDPEAASYLRTLNDPRHLEPDIFHIFSKIMDYGVMELFRPVLFYKQKSKIETLVAWDHEKPNELVGTDKSQEENVSPVLKRCHKIHHRLLQTVDKELYSHLENQQIECQMYLQRYLRCMFSREFSFSNTLIL